MTNIAFLGLGAMGSRMAARLIAAGHSVTAWNRTGRPTPAVAGAVIATTPRSAVAGADAVIAMLRDDEASDRVWHDSRDGALAGMGKGALAIECSTLSLRHVQSLSEAASRAGISFVDAPVAGSRPQAENGQLIFFAGGEAGSVKQAEPILLSMGSAVHHIGPSGSGAAVKLAVNSLFAAQVAAIAEILGALRASGVDDETAFAAISATPVASPAVKAAGASMLARNFAPMFPIELVSKDLDYASRLPSRTPVSAAAWMVMQEAIRKGHGSDNITGVAQLYLE